MKKLIFIVLTFSLFLPGCVYAVRYDGEYSGRVIDADTGEPIEGVVVLGVWNTEYYGAGGAVHKFYDAKETVTDRNGDFSISGQGIEVMSNVTPMSVFIFKAGYEYIIKGPWIAFKKDKLLMQKIKWEGNRVVIPLRKLTMPERKKQGMPDFYIGERYDEKENLTHSCLPKNIKLLPKEVNKELLEQGRKPYELEGGRCGK